MLSVILTEISSLFSTNGLSSLRIASALQIEKNSCEMTEIPNTTIEQGIISERYLTARKNSHIEWHATNPFPITDHNAFSKLWSGWMFESTAWFLNKDIDWFAEAQNKINIKVTSHTTGNQQQKMPMKLVNSPLTKILVFLDTHLKPKPCKCCTINRTTSSSFLWTIFLFRWLLLSPLAMHSPLEVLVSPSLPLEVRFDLCISDSRPKEWRALFCGGGDSPPFCSSSDEARVAGDHEDSQFWSNSQSKKRTNTNMDKDNHSSIPSYCELTSSCVNNKKPGF